MTKRVRTLCAVGAAAMTLLALGGCGGSYYRAGYHGSYGYDSYRHHRSQYGYDYHRSYDRHYDHGRRGGRGHRGHRGYNDCD